MARLLLDYKAHKNKADRCGLTPLHIACGRCLVDIVRMLLEAGVDLNKADNSGVTPLQTASAKGFVEVVRMLVLAGADVNQASYRGSTPLHEACWGGHVDVFVNGRGPFDDASGTCHVAIVRLLLEGQADINKPDTCTFLSKVSRFSNQCR